MTKSNAFISLLISLYSLACTTPETYSCQPTFFQAQQKNIPSDSSISLTPAYWIREKDTICGYDLKITNVCSFKLNPMEYPEHLLEGFIFWEKDQIRYRPINTLTIDYPLADEIEGIFCWQGNVYRQMMDSNKVKFLEHVLIE